MTDVPWRRRLVEGGLIVASILLAFAIDAAWDSRREQQRKDALLSALAREMALAATERDRVARFHETGRDAAAALLSLDPGERNATRVDSLLQDAYNSTATFDVSSGALSGVDASMLNQPRTGEEGLAVPWPVGPTRAYSLVGDPHFRGLLSELWWRYRNSLFVMDDLRLSIDRIRPLIEPASAP